MARADDDLILERARQEDRAVVTHDADFHRLLASSLATAPSVIRIRIQRLDAAGLNTLIQQVVAAYRAELIQGAAVSVEPHRTRVRSLPLT